MNRNKNIDRLNNEEFDICIIGAGASGAGCALDAALRGMKVAMIEKTDFAAETSSKSTKLIHGGVRYLEQAFKNFDFAQLKQVKHGLEERHIVIQNAPHLAHALGLITPVFSWIQGLYFTIGLKLYGFFAKNDPLPTSQWLSKAETLARMPSLTQKIHSSVLYYDGQLDDARYCLALAHSADKAGAVVTNYTEVIDFQKDNANKLILARIKDTISGKEINLKAKVFINCTGAFADNIRLMANPSLNKRIRPSKGVHLMLPAEVLQSTDAMLIPKTPDGRVVFAIPFEGDLMLGTTDNDYTEGHTEPHLLATEVDYLLETLQPFLDKKLDKTNVKGGFGGLRPLLLAGGSKNTKQLLRDHEVEKDEASGLISLMGGKWTTYRIMAKDTIDLAASLLQNTSPCSTENHKLVGATGYEPMAWQNIMTANNLAEDISKHLVAKYGSNAQAIAKMCQQKPSLATRLVEKYAFIEAEVVYQCQHEMAMTPRDVLARRMRLEFMDWQGAIMAAPKVTQLMSQTLGWTDTQTQTATKQYINLVEQLVKAAKN